MNEDSEIHLIRQLLLGQLPGEEAELLQRRKADDPAFREFYDSVEQELIDDFAQGLLTGDDARRFGDRYLASEEGKARAAMAASTLVAIRSDAIRRRNWRRGAYAVAAVLLCVCGAVIMLRSGAPVVATITLYPGIVRSGASATIDASSGVHEIRLDLRPDRTPAGDRAELEFVGREEAVWRAPIPPHAPGVIELDLPISGLPPGDYLLSLWDGPRATNRFVFQLKK